MAGEEDHRADRGANSARQTSLRITAIMRICQGARDSEIAAPGDHDRASRPQSVPFRLFRSASARPSATSTMRPAQAKRFLLPRSATALPRELASSNLVPREIETCGTDKKRPARAGPVFSYVNSVERLRHSRENLGDECRRQVFARCDASENDSPASGAAGVCVAN